MTAIPWILYFKSGHFNAFRSQQIPAIGLKEKLTLKFAGAVTETCAQETTAV